VRSLARLHAISYAYLTRTSDNNDLTDVLKFLVDKSYQATASPSEREDARANLESQFSAVLALLEQNDPDNRVITKARLSAPPFIIFTKRPDSPPVRSLSCVTADQPLTTSSSSTTRRTSQLTPSSSTSPTPAWPLPSRTS